MQYDDGLDENAPENDGVNERHVRHEENEDGEIEVAISTLLSLCVGIVLGWVIFKKKG